MTEKWNFSEVKIKLDREISLNLKEKIHIAKIEVN